VTFTKETTLDETINIAHLDKADVLAALYNSAQPLGLGFLQYDPEPMTRDQAALILEKQTYFDYLKGRVMKLDLEGDTGSTRWYDRDNGEGAAARAIASIPVPVGIG
jgi:hypothetical protein